jgi:coenzyme F420-dependent glucose-6-phosphate dehydrogenase
MMQIGYHASHEQFTPSDLLTLVKLAEDAGFEAILSSDHFHPWGLSQGNGGHAWSWLGAAMAQTKIPFGIVTVPGYRYHPAILAQATATLINMFPQRFYLSVGSGEALNEHITGNVWPNKSERNKLLYESVNIMRKLWKGDEVTQKNLITIEEAKLFVPVPQKPQVIGAALTPQTAEWLGAWADGLITTSRPVKELQEMVDAFHHGGGKGKPLYLKVQISYDKSYEEGLLGAYEQWRNTLLPSDVMEDIKTPSQFDNAGKLITRKIIEKNVLIGSDANAFIKPIKAYCDLGFSTIIVHNVNLKQKAFINFFGKEVLPHLKKK